jgi:hypothetical protein
MVEAKLSDDTKSNYKRREKRFIKWLVVRYNECIDGDALILKHVTAEILQEYIRVESVYIKSRGKKMWEI